MAMLKLVGHEGAVNGVAFASDGRTLATGGLDHTVRIWDVPTGKERLLLAGHRGEVSAVAFSPDGKTLASASRDNTVLVWDLSGLPRAGLPVVVLSALELEALWTELAGDDASRAHRALWTLVAAPRQVVPFLRERLPRLALPPAADVDRWLTNLDDDLYEVREKASVSLARLGKLAEPSLRRALLNPPSLEVRRRLETLIHKLEKRDPAPELMLVMRAVRVLELIGTAEARQVLEKLAQSALPQAQSALQRLARQPVAVP